MLKPKNLWRILRDRHRFLDFSLAHNLKVKMVGALLQPSLLLGYKVALKSSAFP